jgi:hypothetical protein
MWLLQGISIIGAIFILGAFAFNQFGIWSRSEIRYVFFNFIGASILLIIAIIELQYGFIILEGAWASISLVALIRMINMRAPRLCLAKICLFKTARRIRKAKSKTARQ